MQARLGQIQNDNDNNDQLFSHQYQEIDNQIQLLQSELEARNVENTNAHNELQQMITNSKSSMFMNITTEMDLLRNSIQSNISVIMSGYSSQAEQNANEIDTMKINFQNRLDALSTQMGSQNEMLLADIDRLATKNVNGQAELERVTFNSMYRNFSSELRSMKRQVDSNIDELSRNLNERYDRIETDIGHLAGETINFASQIEGLNHEQEVQANEMNSIKSQSTTLSRSVREISEQQAETADLVERIQGAQSGMKQDIDGLLAKQNEHNTAIGNFHRNVTVIEREIAQLPMRVAAHDDPQEKPVDSSEDVAQLRQDVDALGMVSLIDNVYVYNHIIYSRTSVMWTPED